MFIFVDYVYSLRQLDKLAAATSEQQRVNRLTTLEGQLLAAQFEIRASQYSQPYGTVQRRKLRHRKNDSIILPARQLPVSIVSHLLQTFRILRQQGGSTRQRRHHSGVEAALQIRHKLQTYTITRICRISVGAVVADCNAFCAAVFLQQAFRQRQQWSDDIALLRPHSGKSLQS